MKRRKTNIREGFNFLTSVMSFLVVRFSQIASAASLGSSSSCSRFGFEFSSFWFATNFSSAREAFRT